MGNHANKRAAAAAHNARYAERDAVRPKLTKSPGQKAVKEYEPITVEVKPKRSIWRFLPAILAGLLPKSLIGR